MGRKEGGEEVRVSLARIEDQRVNLHVAGGVRVGRADAALSEQPNEEAAASTERTNERTTALAARGQYYHDTDTGHFIIRADAPHGVGDELHICYSTANSQDTLSAYGFVEGWGDGDNTHIVGKRMGVRSSPVTVVEKSSVKI